MVSNCLGFLVIWKFAEASQATVGEGFIPSREIDPMSKCSLGGDKPTPMPVLRQPVQGAQTGLSLPDPADTVVPGDDVECLLNLTLAAAGAESAD